MMHDMSESESLQISLDADLSESPSTLQFSIMDNGIPAQLHTHHGRKVHVVLLSENLDWFGHVHPEDFSTQNRNAAQGIYVVKYDFPSGGEFLLSADVMSESGAGSEQFVLAPEGDPQETRILDASKEKCFVPLEDMGSDRYTQPISLSQQEAQCPQGYKVTLSHSELKAGVPARLQFQVAEGERLVDDLSAYLEAPLHLAVVHDDLVHFMHEHGEATIGNGYDHSTANAHYGPFIESDPIIFPEPGRYVIVPQMKRGNELIIGRFLVEVK